MMSEFRENTQLRRAVGSATFNSNVVHKFSNVNRLLLPTMHQRKHQISANWTDWFTHFSNVLKLAFYLTPKKFERNLYGSIRAVSFHSTLKRKRPSLPRETLRSCSISPRWRPMGPLKTVASKSTVHLRNRTQPGLTCTELQIDR